MKKLVKLVKVNNLEYNVNRDPAVYRRCANESFRIQALVDGSGQVKCKLTDTTGKVVNEQSVNAPGTYTHEVSFPTPGVRVVTLSVEGNGEKFALDIRLDVLEHAWHG
ncbi:MAG: hypothetical protein P4L77_13845 [Sulfuriferula sp.]|nr:hypothetical protein [Sulfuriferula sp.]